MSGPNEGLVKSMDAGAAILKYRILKFSADDTVIHAVAKTDLVVGVSREAQAAVGDPVETILSGIVEVEAGGTIARGDYVVAGAAGVGVAGTAATAKQQAIGIAMASAVSGDIFPVQIVRSQFDLA